MIGRLVVLAGRGCQSRTGMLPETRWSVSPDATTIRIRRAHRHSTAVYPAFSKSVPTVELSRNPTRSVTIGTVTIGDGEPIAVQSMTATPTRDVEATAGQVRELHEAGADVVRIAVDSRAEALAVVDIAS